jgi:pimeloyl-ACP methyl ester carboxylesterase
MKTSIIETSRDGMKVQVVAGGSGDPLVFLHGAGGLLDNDPFLEALAEQYHVYAPVLPGYGELEGADDLEDMLAVTLHTFDVLEALGLSHPRLVGHSMGGMIAAEMAAIAPNDIDELVLISPAGLWLDEHPIEDLFNKLPYELPELLFHDADKGQQLLASGMDFNDPEFLTEFLVGNSRRMGMAGKLMFPIPDRGLARRLYRVTAKTTVIWGEQDRMIPPVYAKAFTERIKQAEVHIIPDIGHMPIYEAPEAVIQAMQAR